jgi:hypothetical protein
MWGVKKMERTVWDIENEMRELYPKKEIAYIDYSENIGDTSGLRERLWNKFEQYRNQWNGLVKERKRILGIT